MFVMLEKSKMSKELLIEQQNFFKFITDYEYVNKDGRLDLEAFCRYLSICFDCDGVLKLSPNPRDMYLLLIELIYDVAEDEKTKKLWVQTQRLIDWTPKVADMYPDGYRTYIHVSALLMVMHDWIYHIGHHLMSLPEDDNDRKYFAWVKPEWTFTFAFINGFHNYFFEFIKKLDKKGVEEGGYSHFEALSMSMRNNVGYDDAAKFIKSRNEAYKDALTRIEKAVESGFYLEAITLEECLISNCIHNFLVAKNEKLKQPTFRELLEFILNKPELLSEGDKNLFVQINKWRKKRNVAIHGFITVKSDMLKQSTITFENQSEETARTGAKYCEQVNSWYVSESVDFISHKFDVSDKINYQ